MWHGKCVPHKALYSHFFLGFQRMPNFVFFKALDDAQISQKHFNYSHSIVPTGLGVRSMSTRLMPSTSLVILFVMWCSKG